MAIYQTNVFICEICEMIVSITKSQSLYCDPVIQPPSEGWDYNKEDKLVCPDCVEKDSE